MTPLPQFIIIGAAKAATTTLNDYLVRHPGICMSEPKEPEFFSNDVHYAQGESWYRALFDGASGGHVCGEASTNYTFYPEVPRVPERMHALLPDAKLIYLMREPVARAYSHYTQFMQNRLNRREIDAIDMTFEEAIETVPRLLDASKYLMQIEQFLAYYPREQMLFLFMDDLLNNTPETLRIVLEWIGADASVDLLEEGPIVANTGKGQQATVRTNTVARSLSTNPLARAAKPLVPRALRERIYETLGGSSYGQRVAEARIPKKMLPETRDRLKDFFAPENARLAEFLGEDLRRWA